MPLKNLSALEPSAGEPIEPVNNVGAYWLPPRALQR
jgi:hypothetical protein